MFVREPCAEDDTALRVLAGMGDDVAAQMSWALADSRCTRRIADLDGLVVGAGARVVSDWHPRWDWLHVAVLPEYRRRGIGGQLAADLEGSVPHCKAKVTRESPGAGLARSLGWVCLQGSEVCRLATRPGSSMPDAVLLNVDSAVVAEAFLAFYRRAHAWDPLADGIGAADIAATHVGDAAATLLVGQVTSPAAVGCLWPDGSGWEFSGGACRDGATREVELLLDAAAAFADGAALHVEVDSGMAELREALAHHQATRVSAIDIVGRLPAHDPLAK